MSRNEASARPALLQTLRLMPGLEGQLAQRFDITRAPPAGPEREALLREQGERFEGLVTSAGHGADAALIEALPKLRVISSFGVGLERLGLGGFGRIGQTIARRAGGFEMPLRYHARRPVAGFEPLHETSLLELARWADVLVVITAGGAATRHLVNAEVLRALGPEGFIVNAARGSVIDEAALVAALVDRRIAGAGLDVFDKEPQVPEALFALDNVVLLPHIASATRETRAAMGQRVFDNLVRFFDSGTLLSDASA